MAKKITKIVPRNWTVPELVQKQNKQGPHKNKKKELNKYLCRIKKGDWKRSPLIFSIA